MYVRRRPHCALRTGGIQSGSARQPGAASQIISCVLSARSRRGKKKGKETQRRTTWAGVLQRRMHYCGPRRRTGREKHACLRARLPACLSAWDASPPACPPALRVTHPTRTYSHAGRAAAAAAMEAIYSARTGPGAIALAGAGRSRPRGSPGQRSAWWRHGAFGSVAGAGPLGVALWPCGRVARVPPSARGPARGLGVRGSGGLVGGSGGGSDVRACLWHVGECRAAGGGYWGDVSTGAGARPTG